MELNTLLKFLKSTGFWKIDWTLVLISGMKNLLTSYHVKTLTNDHTLNMTATNGEYFEN